MEMEDHHRHHHHHHHHQHHQQYAITDLRQLVNGPRFPSIPPPPPQPTAELFPGHPNLAAATHHHHHQQQQHYEMMMFGRQVAEIMPRCLHEFASTDGEAVVGGAAANNSSIGVATTPTTTTTTTSASTPPLSGLGGEGAAGCLGGDASTGRWPRQETLTLLEIRSRLDPKFKEANQKGPLWDEVSRIMSEEHGYQRSGKKCREKFENLYKYYKKTKEGKAGRQDGKHYRFFRQLEALYGENSNNTASAPETNFGGTNLRYNTSMSDAPNNNSQMNQEMHLIPSHHKHCDSLSLTNSTDFDTSSSNYDNDHNSTDHQGLKDNDDSIEKRRKRTTCGKGNWKVKIKDFIDLQMRKLVEKQEEWLDKLMKTLEQKEKERVLREEEWRRQEAARLEREHKFWAKERAWIEARDAALMEALQKLTGGEIIKAHSHSPPEGIMVTGIPNRSENQNEDGSEIQNSTTRSAESWPGSEISRLVQLRGEMETRFRQGGCSEEGMWEEIATKMACFGYERSASILKEKWENIGNNYPRNVKEGNIKKRKENSRSCFYFDDNDYNQGSGYCDINDQRLQTNDGSSPSNSNVGNAAVHAENCFPFLMSTEGGTLWDNYSLKVNKANQNQ